MVRAHIHLEAVLGRRVELVELAERTQRAHGKKRFSQSKLSGYRTGAVKPSLDVIAAYAAATLTDPGWMGFDTLSAAPAPVGAHPQPAAHLPLEPLEPVSQRRQAKKRRRA